MDKIVGLIRSMVSDTDTELKYFRENIPYAFSGKVSKSGHVPFLRPSKR